VVAQLQQTDESMDVSQSSAIDHLKRLSESLSPSGTRLSFSQLTPRHNTHDASFQHAQQSHQPNESLLQTPGKNRVVVVGPAFSSDDTSMEADKVMEEKEGGPRGDQPLCSSSPFPQAHNLPREAVVTLTLDDSTGTFPHAFTHSLTHALTHSHARHSMMLSFFS
jgi:hypothetical protein